jgi:hypothetical protein
MDDGGATNTDVVIAQEIASAEFAVMRIPTQSGRGFRFEAGHRSDLIPATIPI